MFSLLSTHTKGLPKGGVLVPFLEKEKAGVSLSRKTLLFVQIVRYHIMVPWMTYPYMESSSIVEELTFPLSIHPFVAFY